MPPTSLCSTSATCRWRFISPAAPRSRSILKLLPYPTASHPSGSIRFKGRELLELSEREIRGIRGNDISIIFQEPMTSLNPLHTIESQIGEILQLHSGIRGSMARARTLELLTQVGIP